MPPTLEPLEKLTIMRRLTKKTRRSALLTDLVGQSQFQWRKLLVRPHFATATRNREHAARRNTGDVAYRRPCQLARLRPSLAELVLVSPLSSGPSVGAVL